ncbi:MAG: SH3 domain-containing protein [Ruthenibacterium lactatiformans]
MKKTVWKLFAPALCAAVLFAACSKDDSSSSRPQSVSTPPASSSVPPASASSQPASSSSAASSEAASSVPASSSAASSSAAATPTQSTRRGATVRADGGLRLRASASEKSEKLLTIPDGTHIECTGWQSGWAKTTYEGKTGYVSAVYLLYDGKVRADGGLRLRSGGQSYEKLLTVPDGSCCPAFLRGTAG